MRQTFFHNRYVLITAKDTKKYNGIVYNLSVWKDESYITELGITHNCRCTVSEVLASKNTKSDSKTAIANAEKATTQINKNGKNTLEMFRFNPAKTKKLMPPDNAYTKVVGAKEVINILNSNRYNGIVFEPKKGIKNNGVLEKFTSGRQNPQEATKNEKALTILANKGGKYRMLPVIEDGKKNPDALNLRTKQLVDVKVSQTTNGKNIVQSALKEASRQGAEEVVIHLTKEPDSYREMYGAVLNTFKQGRAKNIKIIKVIYPREIVKSYDTNRFKTKKA